MKKKLLYLCLFFSAFSLVAQNECDPNPIPNHDFKLKSNGNRPDFWEKEDKVGLSDSDCGVTVSNTGVLGIRTCYSYLIDFNGNLITFTFPNSATCGPFPIDGNPTSLKGGMGFNKDLNDRFSCEIIIWDDCFKVISRTTKHWNSTIFENFDIPITYTATGKGAYAQIGFYLLPTSGLDMGVYSVGAVEKLEFGGLVAKPSVCPAPNYLHATSSIKYAYINWDEDECADFYTLRYRKEGETAWSMVNDITISELNTLELTPCTSYEMQVKVTRKDGAVSDYSDSYFMQMQGCGGSGICVSYGNPKNTSYIDRVQFDVLSPRIDSINGTKAHGYFDRREFTVYYYNSLVVKSKPKGVGANEKLYWQVWIDVNNNQKLDSDELMAKVTTTGLEEMKTNTITLPSNVTSGLRLMRIQMSKTANISACEANFEGEIRDYTLSVDYGCGPATRLSAKTVGNTSFTLVWLGSADSIRVRVAGEQTWYTFPLTGYDLKLVGATPCAIWEAQAITKCSNKLFFTDIFRFHTSGCSEHCVAYGSQRDFIKDVSFNTLYAYTNKNEGYTNYSDCTKVEAGKTYTYAASPGFPSGTTAQAEYWRVYIDYNEDKDFEDSGELVYDSGKAVLGAITTQITIPANTPAGTKVMRTVMKRITATEATPPTACGSFTFGEVEDYPVKVIKPIPVAPSKPNIITVGATTFCEGASVTLTAPDGYNYLWSNNETTQTIIVSKSGSYSVVVKDKANGLSSPTSNSVFVKVNPKPALSIAGNEDICYGSSLSLTASGNGSFLWNTGYKADNFFVPGLTLANTYSVTLTDANQCTATQSVQINILPLPILSIAGSKDICYGSSLSLTASGNGTFLWNTGYKADNFFVPSLTASNTYSVTLTGANQCSASQSVQINILSLPQINAVASNINPCLGDKISLIAIGADTYTWSSVAEGGLVTSTGGTVEAKPAKEGKITYSTVGTDTKGCKSAPFNLDVTVKNCGVATADKDIENDVIVFPNPFSEKIFFTNTEKIESVTVFDALGKLILIEKNISEGIEFQHLSNQTYFLKIKMIDGKVFFKKVIKQ